MRLISPLRKNWTILEDIFGCHNREDMTTGAKNGQKLKDILQCTEQNSSTHTKDHLTENVNMVSNSIAWQLSMTTPSLSKFYILSVLCECVNECVCGREEYVCICVCTHVEVRGQLSGWFSAYTMGSGNWTQVVRFAATSTFTLSHLTDPLKPL